MAKPPVLGLILTFAAISSPLPVRAATADSIVADAKTAEARFRLRPGKTEEGELNWVCRNARSEDGLNAITKEQLLAAKGGECSDLRGMNLAQADLRNFNLKGADLRGADLTGARLNGAEFTGARLELLHLGALMPASKELDRLTVDNGLKLGDLSARQMTEMFSKPDKRRRRPASKELDRLTVDGGLKPGDMSSREAMETFSKHDKRLRPLDPNVASGHAADALTALHKAENWPAGLRVEFDESTRVNNAFNSVADTVKR